MAVLYTPHFIQFFDDDGEPLSGGKLYTYQAGTTAPKATFTTADGDVESANPIILDAAGRATLFLTGSYKFTLTDSNDVLVRTTDDITAFTATAEEADAFFQSFSGDGTQTAFTLSEDLGTDEKTIMVFVSPGAAECVDNGDFATDTIWTKGTGWTIGSGVATATGAISTNISQTSVTALKEDIAYRVTFTITRSAGGLIPSIGGTVGTERTASGTYTEIIVAGSTQEISFNGNAFTGTLDDVTVNAVSEVGFDIQAPTAYTVNGTSLTFGTAPGPGTNNIQVWAPARLANAAAASAAAADTSATNAAASAVAAAASETNAQNYAESYAGTSTTSLLIGTGAKVFTTQASKLWVNGQLLQIASDADAANYMHGTVTSYSGTALTMNITDVGGSGTLADWNISISGTQGPVGAALVADGSVTEAKHDSTGASSGDALTADGAGGATYEPVSSGVIAQIVTSSITPTTSTNTFPSDDTIPLVSEGDQVHSVAITTTSASNKVRMVGAVNAGIVGGGNFGVAAFRGSTCLWARNVTSNGTTHHDQLVFHITDTPGSAAAHTYTIRVGKTEGSGSTISWGNSTTARFGDAAHGGSIDLEEIVV